jgi:hypothetical protein
MNSEKFHSGVISQQEMIVTSMKADQQLPSELPARIHYVCKSKTRAGNYQAKCSYLYSNREYSGIVFAPDNENWFETLKPGTIIKAKRIEPGKHPDFPGDLKGDALPFAQQQELPLAASNPLATLPELLRQAADLIEQFTGQVAQNSQTKTQKPDLKYRTQQDWANIIETILLTVPAFHNSFSAIILNAYIESTFHDFWPGDTSQLKKGPRWKAATTRALSLLLDYGTIQRIKGTSHHYELTESTRSKLSSNK